VNRLWLVVKQYLILMRPYGMLFLGFTPVFGALANGETQIMNLFFLLIIGCFSHIFTFVQNDYYDVAVDSKSAYVAGRPLITGSIPLGVVVWIIWLSFMCSLLIAGIVLFSIFSFIVLLLSFVCMTFYNRLSKRFAGMEYILSMGVLCFGLFGALTVSENLSVLVVLVVLFGFFQWLFSVGVCANLKDVEFDTQQGISTTPVLFGVHVEKGLLVIPGLFRVYAFGIKIVHILMALLVVVLEYTSFWVGVFPIPGLLFVVISFIIVFLSYRIVSFKVVERDVLLISIGLQEGLSFLLLPVALMRVLVEQISLVGTILLLVVLVVWPVFWFRVLYGRRLIPLE
jgi:4-hydroxybenzoate polyprenyltransferase